MKETVSQSAICTICHLRPADKTNSHLIPSFFIAMVSSVDGSYRRDKELLYTIGNNITTAYIGRSVREDELRNSFDTLSDERLSMMSENKDAKDYIFCSHCERKLGEYLESPWHDHLFNNKNIDPCTAYFFWVSLLWRISAFDGVNFKLPTHIEKSLRKRLNAFIQAKDDKNDMCKLMSKLPFTYRVLYCKDYSKHQAGLIHYNYDRKSKIAYLLLGDVVACFSFNRHKTFDKLSFYGLEPKLLDAPNNDGSSEEVILNINADNLNLPISKLIFELQNIRLKADRRHIIDLWDMAKTKMGMPLPDKPVEPFIQFVIKQLYDDTVKIGEKITLEYYAKCFALGLEKFYNIHL